jgi:hypothetical protein
MTEIILDCSGMLFDSYPDEEPIIDQEQPEKESIAVDFDGVIHGYSKGWQDGSTYDQPIDGVKSALEMLGKDYKIVIYTARLNPECGDATEQYQIVADYLDQYEIPYDEISLYKPIAKYYVDDRAIHFKDWNSTLLEINTLKQASLVSRHRRKSDPATEGSLDLSKMEPCEKEQRYKDNCQKLPYKVPKPYYMKHL